MKTAFAADAKLAREFSGSRARRAGAHPSSVLLARIRNCALIYPCACYGGYNDNNTMKMNEKSCTHQFIYLGSLFELMMFIKKLFSLSVCVAFACP